jgi:tetratricopeptide (TPR) repeat protein
MCAIRERQSNAGTLMERFIQYFPTSTKRNQGCIEMGHFYFLQENYNKALIWYEKVDEMYMGAIESDKYNFQKGYSFFITKNTKAATSYFNKLINSDLYGAQAKYYLGFIAYERDDYKEASHYFEAVSLEEKYKERVFYYQSDMNFQLGNFEKAIELGVKAKHLTTTAKVPHPYEYVHDEIGYNFRMPNLNAALACAQLEQLDFFIENKRKLAQEYNILFKSKGINFRTELPQTKANYWLMCIELENKKDKEAFLKDTNENGVMTRPIWQLIFKSSLYSGFQKDEQINAKYLEDRIVNIPSSVKF